MSEITLSRRLARRIRGMAVSHEDRLAAERYVRDWLGSMVAGGGTGIGARLRAYAVGRQDLEGRVFLAAALSHVTETDDLHRGSITHPGCVVVPVALLVGRARDADGRAVLEAVLAGYEAMLRVGEALGPAHYRIFHNTATAGVFGAAAAAAQLLGLDEDGWVWALGNAGTQAAGLWQFNADATMSKHLHAGHAAEAGLRAALLAAEGFTGPAAILEGDRGFFRGYCPDAVPERVLADAAGWKLRETSFKPYPSCRHTHPAIDAALELRAALLGDDDGVAGDAREATGDRDFARTGDFAGAIDAVRIATYPVALDVTDRPHPGSPYAAKFSLQYCVATTLLHGRPGLDAFALERIEDGLTWALLERTSVEADGDMAAAYPERWGAVVEIRFSCGAVLDARRTEARGDPESPLTDHELDEKFHDLCTAAGIGEGTIGRLLAECGSLPQGGMIQGLPWIDPAGAHRTTTSEGSDTSHGIR
jgi:2-methylcitrate dehydratase PrpD